MNQIDSTTIFLMFLFILPGFLTYLTSTSLYKKENNPSELVVTYKSLLYSSSLYILIYVTFKSSDIKLYQFIDSHIFLSLLLMVILSILWGIVIFWLKKFDVLYKILASFKLIGQVEPPNLYAAMLDPEYSLKAQKGYWLIFIHNGVRKEGYVAYTDVKGTERLVYVTGIKEFLQDGTIIVHRDSYGLILDLRKFDSIDVIFDES